MNPMIPKDFPSRSTCFADSHFDFLSYFPGWFVNSLIRRIRFRFAKLYKFKRRRLVIKCYLVLIELIKYILCFSSLPFTVIWFLWGVFSIRTLFTALQAQINIAIRNKCYFVEIFSRVIKYLIQKYIILWLVKPNKTYNEFTAKKI
jgi:hypothetical protein